MGQRAGRNQCFRQCVNNVSVSFCILIVFFYSYFPRIVSLTPLANERVLCVQMKYGLNLPNFGWFGDIDFLIETAVEAEDAGWDGFTLWDHVLVFKQEDMVLPFVDPWIALSAIACNTSKITLCPLVVMSRVTT